MKAKFTIFLLTILAFAIDVNAQTINTTVGSTGYNGGNNSGAGSFITFVIENNSGGAILLTDVGNYTTTSHNGTTSTLYYSATSLSGPITGNALPAAGWTVVGTATVSGIVATGVNPVITGMSFIIPAGTTYRFALHTTGTNYYSGIGVGTASPNTFTVSGITMRTGDYQISGSYVGYGFSNNPRFFTGFATFMPATPCSGTPTAGVAAYSPGCPSFVGLTGFTLAANISIQWQKRDVCGGAGWTNIAGATGANYNIGLQTNATDYRAYIVCTTSGLSDTSNIVNVTSVAPCYCTSGATSTFFPEIVNVQVGALTNTSTCATTGGAGSILNQYSNYTTVVPPLVVTKGSNQVFSVGTDNCNLSTTTTNGLAIFIDYNGNGLYTDVGEKVYTSATSIAAPGTFTGNFTIPTTATTGTVGMRIVNVYNASGASISSCGTYLYGETEDYLVKILYAATITGGGPKCSGQNDTLRATAPGINATHGYIWIGPNGFTSTDSTIILNNLQTSQSGTYTVRVLTYPCAGGTPDTSGPASVEIYVNQSPGMPQVASQITYCQFATFDSIPVFGQNLKWYTVPTGGIGTTTAPVINTSVYGSVTWYVSQTTNVYPGFAGCEGPRKAVTITVVPQAASPTVVSPVAYCQGEPSVPLQATGQNLLWYSTATGGTGTAITPTPTTNAQGVFTWYVSQSIQGCESPRVPVVVNVNYRPNGIITLSRKEVCQYDTLLLNYFGNADSNADFKWTMPNGAVITTGSDSISGPLVVRFDTAGVARVSLIIDNGGCIGPEALVDIPVKRSPVFTLDIQSDACKHDIINLAVNYASEGIDLYQWDMSGAEIVYGSFSKGPYGVRWNTAGNKVITVIATNDNCVSLPVTDVVNVHELPVASINKVSNTKICAGDSILLDAYFQPGYSYQWLPAAFFGETGTAQQWARIDFSQMIKLNVTDEYNCRNADSVAIIADPCCEVKYPTAFTPNSDGRNDYFHSLMPGHHQIISFRVQNRWGQTVFETADERTKWDGTYQGQPQDMGTYFYYVKYKCQNGKVYEEKGEVTLVR